METRCFKGVGCLSALGLDASGIGGLWEPETADGELAVLADALANGLWLVDTSEVYGGRRAEELIDRALSTFMEERDEVLIVTLARIGPRRELAPRGWAPMTYSCRTAPSPIYRAVRAFGELIDRGIIRFWGLGDVGVDKIKEGEEMRQEVRHSGRGEYLQLHQC